MDKMIIRVNNLLRDITMSILGIDFSFKISYDIFFTGERVFIQILYTTPCSKTSQLKLWKGRKWYLSEFMTDDEIIKTAFAAFEMAVKHEVMEGFKIGGIVLFNPHVDYLELLKISHKEVSRK